MNLSEQLKKLFSSELNEMNESQYEKIAAEYPYCSLAQFNFLQFLNKNNLPGYEEQTRKTALYFKNIPWLKWQLKKAKKYEVVHEIINEEIIPEVSLADKIQEVSAEPKQIIEETKQIELVQESIHEKLPEEEIIAFEPLHTVDYFASQGIKISEEPVNNDKLGTQMKSFTEWLKSMKKINAQKLAEGNEQTDAKIQNIAEHSLAHTDVLTEAMAQILIKQNKRDKAIGMYEKLSLINPTKKAYFAAKIESLKSA